MGFVLTIEAAAFVALGVSPVGRHQSQQQNAYSTHASVCLRDCNGDVAHRDTPTAVFSITSY
jgi:hypothetical protein